MIVSFSQQTAQDTWWGCLGDVCFASKKSSKREFFVPAGTHVAVKLLTAQPLGAHVCAQLFNELRDRLITFLLFVP